MATQRKPPPPGYERHPLDPNLLKKIVPVTAAAALYPYLDSEEQRRVKEAKIEKAWRERKR